MQVEVVKCLQTLEIPLKEAEQSINIKRIKESYLRLAQKYHPDSTFEAADEENYDAAEQDMFIEVKAAFDKLVEMNQQWNGALLTDPEAELLHELEQKKKREQMHKVKMQLAAAKAAKKAEESIRLQKLQEELEEENRLKQLRRQAVIDKQVSELDHLRQYEIKMLVRMDKEFSDITYIPTSSLGEQIAGIVKRDMRFHNSEEAKHGRPYYDYEEQVKLFDQSAVKSRQIE